MMPGASESVKLNFLCREEKYFEYLINSCHLSTPRSMLGVEGMSSGMFSILALFIFIGPLVFAFVPGPLFLLAWSSLTRPSWTVKVGTELEKGAIHSIRCILKSPKCKMFGMLLLWRSVLFLFGRWEWIGRCWDLLNLGGICLWGNTRSKWVKSQWRPLH